MSRPLGTTLRCAHEVAASLDRPTVTAQPRRPPVLRRGPSPADAWAAARARLRAQADADHHGDDGT